MTGYIVFALAVAAAVAIKLDAARRDPYFAYSDLVPGTAITTALGDGDVATRRAVAARFAYPVLLGVVVALVVRPEPIHAVLAGVILATLMLWPIIFHGLPRGVLRSDWLLLPLYLSIIVLYAGASLIGQQFVLLVADGNLVDYVRDRALEIVVGAGVIAVASGLLPLTTKPRRNGGKRRG